MPFTIISVFLKIDRIKGYVLNTYNQIDISSFHNRLSLKQATYTSLVFTKKSWYFIIYGANKYKMIYDALWLSEKSNLFNSTQYNIFQI